MSSPGLMGDFLPLEKRSLGENIAAHLQELLLNGSLRPGDHLPSQRELAARYGTSVAAVREAISILSAAGVLDARPGVGTVVLPTAEGSPSINLWLGAIHDEAEALAFLDTRQVLEHATIARAAERATPEQLAHLQRLLAELQAVEDDPEAFIQADLALHFAIAQAAGNPVTTRLLRAIHTPLANVLRAVSAQLLREGRFSSLYLTHKDIVAAITARDPQGAVAAFDRMLDHTTTDGTLQRALGWDETPGGPLGEAFLEDLRWNLTRLIGPMAEVLIPEAASGLGVDVPALQRRHLRPYLTAIGRGLPDAKGAEWQALTDLLTQRYDPPGG